MTSNQLKPFRVYYQFTQNKKAVVKIVASGNNLISKNQWDGVESTYSPGSEQIFFMKSGSNSLNIIFEKNNNGNITSGTDFLGRIWNKGKNYTRL
jgi:hypothetical protein